MESKTIEKDVLWNGLPAIFYKEKYIVFSPYSKKIVRLNEEELEDKKILEKLKKKDFFGNPLKKPQAERLTIMFYLTDACNLKCVYCFDNDCPLKKEVIKSQINKNKVMTSELALKQLKIILNNFDKFLPSSKEIKLEVHFFGGEPTLAMNTLKTVTSFLKKSKIDTKFRISTNGVTKEENLKYLINNNFLFDIACDGPPAIHDKQRPSKAGFKSSLFTEKMIKLLVKNKARVRTKVVVTKDSTPYLTKTVEYLALLGINHIRLEPVLIDGRAENSLRVDTNEFLKRFIESIAKAKELSKKYERNIWISSRMTRDLFDPSTFSCQYVEGNSIIITPAGNLSKCIRNIHSEESSPFIVGKISDNKLSLNQDKLRNLQNLSVCKMDDCKNCPAKYICSGDCINENYEATGKLNKPNPTNCKMNKEMVHDLIVEMYKQANNSG